MDNTNTEQTISAIVSNEAELEVVINDLIAESVSRADISVQGTPKQIKEKYGVSFLAPEVIQDKTRPPTKEPYLQDDVGWSIGFAFAIPFFICLVIGVFVIADIRDTPEVWIYGTLGGLVGLLLGYLNAKRVNRKYEKKWTEQEEQGGFVIWVATHNEEQYQKVMEILKKYPIKNTKDIKYG